MIRVSEPGINLEAYLSGISEEDIKSGEKTDLMKKLWGDYRGRVIQRFKELESARWIIYANGEEVSYGAKENTPTLEEVGILDKMTGESHYLFMFNPEPRVTEIELTPALKKKQKDIDWWYEAGQRLIDEKEHAGKYVGVRDKQVLIFNTLKDAIDEIKTKGLSFLTKCECKDVISIPSYDIIY